MPYRLLRFAFRRKYPGPRMFRRPEHLRDHYDVVIIGGGGHALATAYYLARELGGMPVGWQAIRDRLHHTTCICSPANRAYASISATRCP
jgi:hypothetical protein